MLTHHKGRGKIIDAAFVCHESYLGIDCIAQNEAAVYDSYVGSKSRIGGRATVIRSEVWHSRIEGEARVWGGAYLLGVRVMNKARIAGASVWARDAEDIIIDRLMWLDRGRWFAAPRYAEIEGAGLHVGLTECVDGRYHIGCTCQTYDEWTREGYRERLGQRAGWQPDQIEFAFQTFHQWHTNPLSSPHPFSIRPN